MSEANVLKDFITTTKSDRVHFNSTNQSHYCWQKYNEYVLCVKKSDLDEDKCVMQRNAAVSFCPDGWVKSWDEQRQNGTFLGVQERAPQKTSHH